MPPRQGDTLTWSMLIKRLRADAAVVAAAFVIVLLAITLLAAAPIYAGAVSLAGLRASLQGRPVSETTVAVQRNTTAAEYAAVNGTVTAGLERVYAPFGGQIVRSGVSGPFLLPEEVAGRIEQPADDERLLHAVFCFTDGIQQHSRLIDGSWPAPNAERVEVAISDATARVLQLAVGDELTLASRLPPNRTVTAVVSATYGVADPDAPFWQDDELSLNGVVYGESTITFGPLMVERAVFFNELTTRPLAASWVALPDWSRFELRDLDGTRAAASQLPARLAADLPQGSQPTTQTNLPFLLIELDRALLAARSGVYIVTIQLALLSIYALLLAAQLLSGQRRVETALLQARGAGLWRQAGMAVREASLLVIPAVIAAPWVASLSLRMLNWVGPLAELEIDIEPRVGSESYLAAGIAGLGCLIALTGMTLLASRAPGDARATRGRALLSSPWARAGIDLALLAVATLGFFQLHRYGAPLTETVQGRLAIDPLLVAAPALGALAGAIIALRLIPLLGRVIEHRANALRGMLPALSAWQFARRAGHYTRAALLLILALSIGIFAVSYTRTWSGSHRDQANYQVGADIAVLPDRDAGALQSLLLASSYRAMDGVTAAMPIDMGSGSLAEGAGAVRIATLDAAQAAEVVELRDDLSPTPLATLMEPLVDARPPLAAIPLPGEPTWLALDLTATISRICQGDEFDAAQQMGAPYDRVQPPPLCLYHPQATPDELMRFDVPVTPGLVLRDRFGALHRVSGAPLASNGERELAVFALTFTGTDGGRLLPSYPLELVSFEFTTTTAPDPLTRDATVEVFELLHSASDSPTDWESVPLSFDNGSAWATSNSVNAQQSLVALPSHLVIATGSTLQLSFSPGISGYTFNPNTQRPVYARTPVRISLGPPQTKPPLTQAIPAIVSRQIFTEVPFEVGDSFPLQIAGEERTIEITGVVDAFPTFEAEQDAVVIVDWVTVMALRYFETGEPALIPTAFWLGASHDDAEAAGAALNAPPFSSNDVIVRDEVVAGLHGDPVALGAVGALSLGFVAAALFATVGFISSAAVAARERLTEFALLRALGLSRRQLAASLLFENALLISISLVSSLALGLLLSRLILPLITVNRDATRVFPSLIVVIPWDAIMLVQGLTLATLLLVSAVLALMLRRSGLGELLRLGED